MMIDDIITGEKFMQIADIIFCPNNETDIYCKYCVDLSIINELNKPIIYTHTDYASQLFSELKEYRKKNVKIITHNSDKSYEIVPPSNVDMLYGQNINIQHERVKSIPLGLENSIWFPQLNKKEKIILLKNNPQEFKNLLYINYNINTNISERLEPINLFKNKRWATFKESSDYDTYINDIHTHKFILCPNGNGIDTVRLWETLYLNSIPIVKHSINSDFYNDLPILFINDWYEINEEFLEKSYQLIINSKWNFDKLKFSYWKNKIKNG